MTTDTALVSVILPTYNAQTIANVLAQDYAKLELLVVDDVSTGGAVDHPRMQDTRIRVLRQQNAGPASARNLGLAHARGDLIAFFDADDFWLRASREQPGKVPGPDRRQIAAGPTVWALLRACPPSFLNRQSPPCTYRIWSGTASFILAPKKCDLRAVVSSQRSLVRPHPQVTWV